MARSYTIDAEQVKATATAAGGTHAVILTKYYGATNTRGARIVARLAGAGKRPRVSISYPYELNPYEGHTAAALCFARAAALGDPVAALRLAACFETGVGVPADAAAAISLLQPRRGAR